MSLVSPEDAEVRRQNWSEDVQWNVARMDEAFRLAVSIVGEYLAKALKSLYYASDNTLRSSPARWHKYFSNLRELAEQNKGSLLALRLLWKAVDELPPKPEHLKGTRNAGDLFKRVITLFMRAVFAAEMGLRLRPPRGDRHRPSKLARAFDKGRPTVEGGRNYREHPFIVADRKGALRAEIWEPGEHVEGGDHGPLKALAAGLGLECVVLPSALGMWVPGRTVPIVFYQRQSSYRPNIEAAIERMVQELPGPS